MTVWIAIVLAGLGCWLLKVAGLSVPPRILERPLVERVADLIPVALLSALIAVQVFTTGSELTLDARAVGLGVAVVLLVLRAPFLVVVFGAAAVAAPAPARGMTRPGRREPSGPRAVLECSVHRDRGFHHGKGSTSRGRRRHPQVCALHERAEVGHARSR